MSIQMSIMSGRNSLRRNDNRFNFPKYSNTFIIYWKWKKKKKNAQKLRVVSNYKQISNELLDTNTIISCKIHMSSFHMRKVMLTQKQ